MIGGKVGKGAFLRGFVYIHMRPLPATLGDLKLPPRCTPSCVGRPVLPPFGHGTPAAPDDVCSLPRGHTLIERIHRQPIVIPIIHADTFPDHLCGPTFCPHLSLSV